MHCTDIAIALAASAFIPVHPPSSAVQTRAIALNPKRAIALNPKSAIAPFNS
ncbi:hypothetical protein QUA13_21295 [Microcoleus sp. S28C3]|uniref:hypothetical protein n=1 Tax=Microcoleus sp. S28C3 TaxID=3055414 RepID=UPI002FD5B772